jgi:hypothetical protein
MTVYALVTVPFIPSVNFSYRPGLFASVWTIRIGVDCSETLLLYKNLKLSVLGLKLARAITPKIYEWIEQGIDMLCDLLWFPSRSSTSNEPKALNLTHIVIFLWNFIEIWNGMHFTSLKAWRYQKVGSWPLCIALRLRVIVGGQDIFPVREKWASRCHRPSHQSAWIKYFCIGTSQLETI